MKHSEAQEHFAGKPQANLPLRHQAEPDLLKQSLALQLLVTVAGAEPDQSLLDDLPVPRMGRHKTPPKESLYLRESHLFHFGGNQPPAIVLDMLLTNRLQERKEHDEGDDRHDGDCVRSQSKTHDLIIHVQRVRPQPARADHGFASRWLKGFKTARWRFWTGSRDRP